METPSSKSSSGSPTLRGSSGAIIHGVDSFRHLAEALPQIVWTATPDGTVDYLSPQYSRFTYVPVDDPEYLNGIGYVHPRDRKPGLAAWARSVRSGKPFENEYRLRGGNGKYYWFAARATPVRNAEGNIIKWYGTGVDIDKQKSAELAQQALATEKDEFIAMLSHELRNPLATIATSSEILQNPTITPQQKDSALHLLKNQTNRLVRLVDETLDISRLNLDMLEIAREKIEITQLVTQCIDNITPQVEKNWLTITPQIHDSKIWVDGDSGRLSQCVANLLDNASKYTNPGGNIDVSLTIDSENGQTSITVQDTGIGISDDELKRLFEPYHQGRNSQNSASSGLGLGLSLIQELVALHHGSVSARSEGIGLGSIFTITLPIAKSETSPTTPEEDTKKILIIEDNENLSQTLQLFFELEGHQTHLAAHGEAALTLLEELHPDVIFCDLSLPGKIQGWDFPEIIRGKYPHKQQPHLVAFSGLTQPKNVRKSLNAGFAQHLPKPATPTQLRESLIQTQNNKGKMIPSSPHLGEISHPLTSPMSEICSKPKPSSAPAYEISEDATPEEDDFRHLAEALPQIVWTANSKGVIDYISSQYSRFTGISDDDPDYLNAGARTHPEDHRTGYRAWIYAVKNQEIYEAEYRLKAADGTYRWFTARGIPVKNPKGETVKWYGTTSDIDKQKQAELELQTAIKDKDNFIAMLSHGLRTPLATISTSCDILCNDKASPLQEKNTLSLLDRQIKHLRQLVNDTLPTNPSEEAPPESPEDHSSIDPGSLQILIIEDNESVARSLEMFFQLEGHLVYVAGDGKSAFTLLHTLKPDIVFCDLSLPGEYQGWDIAQKICLDHLEDRPPYLIALSGHTQPHHIDKCNQAGFKQHLAKPATPDQLRKGIQMALSDLAQVPAAS